MHKLNTLFWCIPKIGPRTLADSARKDSLAFKSDMVKEEYELLVLEALGGNSSAIRLEAMLDKLLAWLRSQRQRQGPHLPGFPFWEAYRESLYEGPIPRELRQTWSFSTHQAFMRVAAKPRLLRRDHRQLIKMGESYGSFDPLGKIAFLDQLERIEAWVRCEGLSVSQLLMDVQGTPNWGC